MTLYELTVTEEIVTGLVLVVDDNEAGRETLVDILRAEGLDAISAADGESALLIIGTEQPDLVLLDVMLPELSGMKVLQELRADPATRDLPVIMVTVLDQPEDIVFGLETGANDYLVKPIQPEILIARVRTQLKLRHLQEQRDSNFERMQDQDAIKDKFLQIAAHDLQAPIANILAGVDLLSMANPETAAQIPDFDLLIRIIKSSATMMHMIVSDFLDHDALRAGKLKLELHPSELNPVIETAVIQFHSTAEKKNIQLSGTYDPQVGLIQIDPVRIMQVATNLIGNAIKFSPPGSKVSVRTVQMDDCVRVEVSDQGPGINDADMRKLFQEFARLENKPTGGEKSSGLGLAISRQLIEMHGGKIGAKSAIGKGTTFWFELKR